MAKTELTASEISTLYTLLEYQEGRDMAIQLFGELAEPYLSCSPKGWACVCVLDHTGWFSLTPTTLLRAQTWAHAFASFGYEFPVIIHDIENNKFLDTELRELPVASSLNIHGQIKKQTKIKPSNELIAWMNETFREYSAPEKKSEMVVPFPEKVWPVHAESVSLAEMCTSLPSDVVENNWNLDGFDKVWPVRKLVTIPTTKSQGHNGYPEKDVPTHLIDAKYRKRLVCGETFSFSRRGLNYRCEISTHSAERHLYWYTEARKNKFLKESQPRFDAARPTWRVVWEI